MKCPSCNDRTWIFIRIESRTTLKLTHWGVWWLCAITTTLRPVKATCTPSDAEMFRVTTVPPSSLCGDVTDNIPVKSFNRDY